MTFKEIVQSIDYHEKKLLFLLSLVLILITFAPTLFSYLSAPAGSVYTGIHVLTPGDFNVYYSYLEQVKEGKFLFQDLYTSEQKNSSFFNPFWLVVGLFARLFHLPNWLAIQLSRLLLIPVFIVVAYLFISYLFSEKIKRKVTVLFLVFSSGIGGLLAPILEKGRYIEGGYYHWPMDLWVPEAVSFLSLYHLPHILASSILFLVVFLFFLLALENNLSRYSLLAGLALLLWLWFHPFHFFTVFFVILAYLFVLSIKRKKILLNYLKHSFIIFFVSVPAIVYHIWLLRFDQLALGRAVQNILITPVPWLLLVSYGFLGILAIFGFFLFLKKEEKYLFVAIWFFVQFFLLYAPLTFQRRLSQNFHFPIVILAVAALFFLHQLFSRKSRPKFSQYILNNKILLWFLFIILYAFSNIYVLANDFRFYQKQDKIFYLQKDYCNSFIWFKNNTKENDVILSEQTTGNFIPGFSGRKVYIGHDVETVNYENKKEKMEWFFSTNQEDEAKEQFLEDQNITYVYYSVNEDKLGDFDPENKKYLERVFKQSKVTIYRVIR